MDRLQNSQNLTKEELAGILKQSGLGLSVSFVLGLIVQVLFRSNERFGRIEQHLERAMQQFGRRTDRTEKKLCSKLEESRIETDGQSASSSSGQNQPNVRELKNENNFLKDYVHRLNSGMSDYQEMYPPASTARDTAVRFEDRSLIESVIERFVP